MIRDNFATSDICVYGQQQSTIVTTFSRY